MRKVTRWSPDTCSCVLEYEWDSDMEPEARIHRPISALPCEHHKQHGHHAKIHAAVLSENQKKNLAIGIISEKTGLSAQDVKFSHDSNRKLSLTLPKEHLAKAKQHLNDNGHGDVEVVSG